MRTSTSTGSWRLPRACWLSTSLQPLGTVKRMLLLQPTALGGFNQPGLRAVAHSVTASSGVWVCSCHKQESVGGHTQAAGSHIHHPLKQDLSNSRGKMVRKARQSRSPARSRSCLETPSWGSQSLTMHGAPLAKAVINVFAQEKQLAEATDHIWQGTAAAAASSCLPHPPPLSPCCLPPLRSTQPHFWPSLSKCFSRISNQMDSLNATATQSLSLP